MQLLDKFDLWLRKRRLQQKREAMIREYYAKMFILGGMVTSTDTYKRTMGAAFRSFALDRAAYHLTFRRGLSEAGAGDQLIMAGHEDMLNQWFNRPLVKQDIRIAQDWADWDANVKAFPHEMWEREISKAPGLSPVFYLDVDVWGFPGGQSFLKNVPALSFEGVGGVISFLEPAMCRYFAPVIQATKARLMSQVTEAEAEFGLRAAVNELANIALLRARYVGSGGKGQLTSNDTAVFMFPELFRDIGTIGHEGMSSNQSLKRSLAECELEMMNLALDHVPDSKLLCDLVDAETIGLINAIKALKAHPDATKAGIRVDSGEIAAQCVDYRFAMREAQIAPDRVIVYEDEVSPETIVKVRNHYVEKTGEEPTLLFPGAGGYWWKAVLRDTVSAAFKRSWTKDQPNIKFSNSEGKESIPGIIRVYGRGDTMYVAHVTDKVDGEPLYKKLVSKGRIVYRETPQVQAARANATWGKYSRVEFSPTIQGYISTYREKRATERAAARAALESGRS